MPEQNKAIALRVFEEVWNQGNVGAIDELMSPDFVKCTISGLSMTLTEI